MSVTSRNSTSYASTAIGSATKSYSASADSQSTFQDNVSTSGAATFEVVLNTPIASGYQSIYALVDGAATIKFQQSDSVGNNCTIAMTSGVPLIWSGDQSVTVTNPALATGAGGTAANRNQMLISTLASTTIALTTEILHNSPAD